MSSLLEKFLKCVYFRKKQKYTKCEVRDARWLEHRRLLVHLSPCEGSPALLVNLLSGLWGEVRDSSSAPLLFRSKQGSTCCHLFRGCKPMKSGWEKGKQGKGKKSVKTCDAMHGWNFLCKIRASVLCTNWGTFLSAWLLSSPASHWQGLPWAEVTPLHFWVTALGSESHIPCFMYHFIQVPDIDMWRCQ